LVQNDKLGTILHATCSGSGSSLDVIEFILDGFRDKLNISAVNENGDSMLHIAAGGN
jgi:hypothetical protein